MSIVPLSSVYAPLQPHKSYLNVEFLKIFQRNIDPLINYLLRSIILPYFLMQLKRLILLRYFITIFYSAASCLNSFNNSLLYSGRIDISLTFSEFLSIACFGFTVFSTILLPYKFLKIPINDLWTNFLEAAF